MIAKCFLIVVSQYGGFDDGFCAILPTLLLSLQSNFNIISRDNLLLMYEGDALLIEPIQSQKMGQFCDFSYQIVGNACNSSVEISQYLLEDPTRYENNFFCSYASSTSSNSFIFMWETGFDKASLNHGDVISRTNLWACIDLPSCNCYEVK